MVSLGQGIARVAVYLVDTNDAASASQSGSITSNDRVASSAADESQTAPSNSPIPDLYLGKAVSKEDRAALASHARNRLQSDRNDRCQGWRRHFSFVAATAVSTRLPLVARSSHDFHVDNPLVVLCYFLSFVVEHSVQDQLDEVDGLLAGLAAAGPALEQRLEQVDCLGKC